MPTSNPESGKRCDDTKVRNGQRLTSAHWKPRDSVVSRAAQPHLEDGAIYRPLRPTILDKIENLHAYSHSGTVIGFPSQSVSLGQFDTENKVSIFPCVGLWRGGASHFWCPLSTNTCLLQFTAWFTG